MSLLVLLVVILLVFALLSALSGGQMTFGFSRTDAVDTFLRAHVHSGFLFRYLQYCHHVFFHFDFGEVAGMGIHMTDELMRRWSYTLRIAGYGMLFTALLGLPLGVVSAVRKDRGPDRVISAVSMVLSSIPNYCLALLLALLFAVSLGLLPAFGASRPGAFVLPVVTVTAGGLAQLIRVVRAAMLETLGQPFVTTLRAKGLRERSVICVHALRDSFVPIAAALGESAGKLLCGTLVVEKFFAIPGIGYYLVTTLVQTQRDYNVILGCTVTIALLLMLIDLVSDLLYVWADPQMKAHYMAHRAEGGRG